MRAITVRNPWAWAIAALASDPRAKNVENRSAGFPNSYRGPLLVHAGKEPWAGQFDPNAPSHRALVLLRGRLLVRDQRDATEEPTGAVVAVVKLADVHPDTGCCRPWGESAYTDDDGNPRRGVVHLLFENCRRLEPIPCRGALGLWRPPAEVEMAVYEQLGETL